MSPLRRFPSVEELILRGAAHRAQRVSLSDLRDLGTCFWDIESSNLAMDFGIILCGTVKPFGKPAKTFRLDKFPEYEKQRWMDSMLVEALREELQKYRVVVHHYGTFFDVPALNTRLLKWRLPLLNTSRMCFIDTWWHAKRRLRLHSNRLAALITHLDTKVTKSGLDGELWTRAVAGNRQGMNAVVQHNIRDVLALEEVTCILGKAMPLRYTFLK